MKDGQPEEADRAGDTTETMVGGLRSLRPNYQFQPGDLIGGRFVVVQFLARGGMGEVYEVADQHLQGKHIALKTLRHEIATEPAVRARFEREVLLAREVSHPNVCPTYDLFRVDTPGGPQLFLTMKLLRGETLSARLRRSGPLEPAAALAIARQMAQALDAAHQAGVIHRDFKPGNVIIESMGPDVYVCVTDFGLSRSYEADTTLAQTGELPGTLGYIAPEVLQGRIASPAADVYAFGVVLYEMLTGGKPRNRPGRTDFVQPGSLVPGLSRNWDRVILGCLEQDSSRRFQSAGEALAALENPPASLPVRFGKHVPRRRLLEAASAVLLLGAASWLVWGRLDSWLHPLPDQRFVAVIAWPPEPDSSAGALLHQVLDTIGSRLARAESVLPKFAVITPHDIGQSTPKALADVVSSLGANLVLGAALRAQTSGWTLSLRVLDASSGMVLRQRNLSVPSGAVSTLPEGASALAAELLDVPHQLAGRNDSNELARISPTAYRLFTEAEELRSQPNDAGLDEAIEKYQKLIEGEPRFALGYADLSLAYSTKFFNLKDRAYLSLAEKNASLALRYNPDSARSVLAAAIVHVRSGETQQAVDDIARALQLDPGNPQILVYKALAFRDLARPRDEEAVYRDIIRNRPNYWPAYNDLGSILYRQTRYQEAASAFAEAAAVAPRVALPLANQGAMYLLLGQPGNAAEAFRRSLDRAPTEIAFVNLGTILFQQKEYRKALEYYEKGRDLNPKNYQIWRNIADCYTMLGDPKREKENYAQAAELLSDALRTNPRQGARWATLAFFHAKTGRRSDAETDLKAADARGLDRRGEFTKAQALAVLGRDEEALRLVLKCIDEGLSTVDVDFALDLRTIKADPRYQRHLAQRSAR